MTINLAAIERYVRQQTLIERIEQLDAEIAAMADHIYRIEEGLELDHLATTQRALHLAVKTLRQAQAESRLRFQSDLLNEELVGRAPERTRAEQNGEKGLCPTETTCPTGTTTGGVCPTGRGLE